MAPTTEETLMPIYYPDILQQRSAPRTFTYGDKDVMLYALGIGLGADPLDERELPFVYEKGLRVVPTAATVLAAGGRASPPAPELPAGPPPTREKNLIGVPCGQKSELPPPLRASRTFSPPLRTH